MAKEKFPTTRDSEMVEVKTMSLPTKIRKVLEVFDLGKGTKEEKEARKTKFIELMGQYNQAVIKSRGEASESTITSSNENRKKIHDQIMDILRSMSLSKGLDRQQEALLEYLIRDRKEVERMISAYFSESDPNNPAHYTPYQMAHKGITWFASPPGKDEE